MPRMIDADALLDYLRDAHNEAETALERAFPKGSEVDFSFYFAECTTINNIMQHIKREIEKDAKH